MNAEIVVSRWVTSWVGSMPQVHSHEEHELYYMMKGSTTYYIGDSIYQIEAGSFVFVPRGMLHKTAYEETGNKARLLINFPDNLFYPELTEVKEILSREYVFFIPEEKREILHEIIRRIEQSSVSEEPYANVLLGLYIAELLVQLCRYKSSRRAELSGRDAAMSHISKYISGNFSQPLTLKMLSQKFAFSESYLSRSFKSYAGMGISEYLTYVRISNAERFLQETKLSISQIALCCGYNDSNYFSTVFKRIKGISPQQYQKQHKTLL